MYIFNCKECGKVSKSALAHKICDSCIQAHDKACSAILAYQDSNTSASLSEIVANLTIAESEVLYLLRAGRIELSESPDQKLTCRVCGIPITTGTYCPKCQFETLRMLEKTCKAMKEKQVDALLKKHATFYRAKRK